LPKTQLKKPPERKLFIQSSKRSVKHTRKSSSHLNQQKSQEKFQKLKTIKKNAGFYPKVRNATMSKSRNSKYENLAIHAIRTKT
jgi:hypothetical protein